MEGRQRRSAVTTQVRVELEVARSDSAPRPVVLTAPRDATAGDALDVLGARLGLCGASGAVQARSLVSGCWVDRDARLGEVGLLRGERLSLTVGLRPGASPQPLSRWDRWRHGDDSGRVAVNRPPRAVRPEPEVSLPVPTERQHRPARRFPLGAMLIPLAIGLVLVLITRRLEIALFSLFTPVMVAWNYVEERRARADELREYGRTYAEDVAATLARIEETAAAWEAWLHDLHPSPAQVTDTSMTLGPRLWERQPGDPDFLRLRLGLSTRRAPVTLRQDESAKLRVRENQPDYEGAATVHDVPATVDLSAGALAVLATDDQLARTTAWLALQVAALHSPADVLLAGAFSDRDTCDWFRWLPHVAHGSLGANAVVDHARASDELLVRAARLGAERRAEREALHGVLARHAVLVVFVDARLSPDPTKLAAALACHDVGVVVVWIGTDRGAVPAGAAHLLAVDADGGGAELLTHRGGRRTRLVPESLGRSAALELSASLAPVRDATDARRVRSIPDRVALEDLVPDLTSPTAMRRRWERAPLTQLVARLGMSADGPVELDLGPSGSHALVGGTTGSGKSELLQAMVASVAAAYPPSRVGFLLVDYKGGAAFKDAQRLPHCVGVVTDLDEHLTRRVLLALEAEIKRREELLARHGARDLTELRRLATTEAPADLVIVVDEFATLAKEIPEFVEGVVDIAARGRSLGLRLVLATQRPAGVINDRIRANVGVRIALRVNDEADSSDVIDDRQAAHIPRSLPGRAFLKVHRDLAEFQSAYVGGPARPPGTVGIDARHLWAAEAAPTPTGDGPTALDAVVDSALKVMRLGHWDLPHVPWLPAVADVVTVDELAERVGVVERGSVLLGLADLPSEQAQRAVAFDLARHRSLLVFGTSRSGKTTLLRTIAAGLITSMGPTEVEIYGLDFAGHGLHVLEGAPHVAGVTGGDEPGRVVRLLRRLGAMVEERKRALAATGASDFSALAESGTHALPRVVVLLDAYSGATSALERLDGGRVIERLERLVVDGPSVGLHFVITADRRAAVPSALTSVVTTRLVLRMADKDDYPLLGVDHAVSRDARMPPGRGFIQGSIELQVAVRAGGDPTAEHQALQALVETARRRWPDPGRRLGRMPAQVPLSSLPRPTAPLRLPFAIGDLDVAPVCVDLTEGHALVSGPPRSGRSTTLTTLALAAAGAPDPAERVLFLARRSPLERVPGWRIGPVDAGSTEAMGGALADIRTMLAAGRTVLCFVDDADSLSDQAGAALEELARQARDHPVRFVAAVDNRWALRAYGGLVPELRKSKQGVLLGPDIELDGDLVGTRLRTPFESLVGPGRGFLAQRGVSELVHVAQPESG
jgi:S-DNA-T family DNA segregation ATPase FtsK/SpoIIIE